MSYADVKKDEKNIIDDIIYQVKNNHGCQIVVNGVIPSLKYYLRLISSLEKFINIYSQLIENERELQAIHKNKWNELMEELDNDL